MTGDGDNRSCIAWTTDKTGERLEGPPASIAMAKAEGWYAKNGSKWKTMPELMLRYRAAAFFGRLYAPDVLNGMHATEEVEDIGSGPRNVTARTESPILDDVQAPAATAEVEVLPPAKKVRAVKAEPVTATDDGDIFG